ncbi:Zn-dependent exopeptidase [Lophiostoma macrostomum CBS 122681]|uniref:Peptide hydrolase n=1 Tax=Lophiostoma macrostomum CBS 122681 TaxID=1314788 RepID=A0A6A6SUC9_9PLEO|nr:Zn-dependent exopeptidase [Lophiostoma macrostomum CBS 122681]
MRTVLLFISAVALSSALVIDKRYAASATQLYTIELEPGVTRKVTEDEKWKLKAASVHFMDITDFPDLGKDVQRRAAPVYPSSMSQTTAVNALIPKLNMTIAKSNLETLTAFNNRYYKALTGRDSSVWILKQVQTLVANAGVKNATAAAFTHSWVQPSVILTIPGKTDRTVILGAHQDSINLDSPSGGRAPGADDNGSGVVTILEALRVLLTDSRIVSNSHENTIELHFYAAEEAGLLGSQDIFQDYQKRGRNVVAFLQQDMTGYTKGTISAGRKESIAFLTDNVDAGLTAFVKRVVAAYTTLPTVDSRCGYACSDHASANKAGFPAAEASESGIDDMSPYEHTPQDTVDTVDFDHVLQHARMTVGFAVELAFAQL